MNVLDYLQQSHVPFDVVKHPPTYDAQHLAQATHTAGDHVAKTVLLRLDNGTNYVIAVLPATHQIDFDKVKQVLGTDRVELATEDEVAEHCPDCETGVLPPFGSHYSRRGTLLDESLTHSDEMVFEADTHRTSIRMSLKDFVRIEKPLIAAFTHRR
jgi:Ala-tRNA(Pro) deacylase